MRDGGQSRGPTNRAQRRAGGCRLRRDLVSAERCYDISIKLDEVHGAASHSAKTYSYMGSVAFDRGSYEASQRWARQSLDLCLEKGDEREASAVYNQLGMIAQRRLDLDAAEEFYRKSIEIDERNGDELGASKTFHNMGVVAHRRGRVEAAIKWVQRSLLIKEEHGDKYGLADSLFFLGVVEKERNDCVAAEKAFLRTLELAEEISVHGSASEAREIRQACYVQLFKLASQQGSMLAAYRWRRRIYGLREIASGMRAWIVRVRDRITRFVPQKMRALFGE